MCVQIVCAVMLQTVTVELSTVSARRRDGLPGHNGMHIKFARLHDEVVQMTLCKYAGRPHWSLATNRLFLGPCPVRDMYEGERPAARAQPAWQRGSGGPSL